VLFVVIHIESTGIARPPFALDRLHLVGGRSDQILYLLPGPDPAGRTGLRSSALEFLNRIAALLPPVPAHAAGHRTSL
jgi:hypothetical protein